MQIFLLLMVMMGCSSGVGVQQKKIFSEEGESIESVCILPLYTKISGVGVGPDGKGTKILPNKLLIGPYVFSNGKNILSGIVSSGRLIIPLPVPVSAGESLTFDRVLALKYGYKPLLLRREDIFSIDPVIMQQSMTDEIEKVFLYLNSQREYQAELRLLFHVREDVVVLYSEDELGSLNLCAK
jgi:hypothetical protein